MSKLNTLLDGWFELLMAEWSAELSPERKPWLWSRVMFSALESSARSYIYYIEAPLFREQALIAALAYREFGNQFSTEDTDFEALANTICDRNIGYMDESSIPEQPEWLNDEEWELAQYEATHDDSNNQIRPQLAGFISGAFYDMPVKDDSEFDKENVMKVVRACIHQALKKAQQDSRYCNKRAAKPNTNKWAAIWTNKAWDAKQDLQWTEAFIKQHGLQYD
jgi:hypothetical protein